jgi:hypothetical protein
MILTEATPFKGSEHDLLDYNPATSYISAAKTTNTGYIDYDVKNDFNFNQSFMAAFFLNTHNYTNDLGFQIWRSNDYNNWGSVIYTDTLVRSTYSFPLLLCDLSGLSVPVPYMRYWKYYCWNNYSQTIDLAMIMLGRIWDLAPRWDWGSPEGTGYRNLGTTTFSGRKTIRLGNENGLFVADRSYEYISTTDMDKIRGAWDDTKGGAYPMVITDDIPSSGWNAHSATCNSSTSRLVRFNHEPDSNGLVRLGEVQVQNGLWNVTIHLAEVAWPGNGIIE